MWILLWRWKGSSGWQDAYMEYYFHKPKRKNKHILRRYYFCPLDQLFKGYHKPCVADKAAFNRNI